MNIFTLAMSDNNPQALNDNVTIKLLTPEFATELKKHEFFRNNEVLNHGPKYRFFQGIKLIPKRTRLVAYHNKDNIAIGFLCLEKNTEWLYSIKYIYVDKKYRKRGIGTKLLKHATSIAKEKGAKKVNLNVYTNYIKTRELYKKQDFKEIGFTTLGQRFLSGSSPRRIIKRSIVGLGHLTNRKLIKKGKLFNIKTNSRKNLVTLFNIYKNSMSQKWIDFFEIDINNLINGSRHVWRPPFFRDVLINGDTNSFALIFNPPFSSKATVELYCTSKMTSQSLIKNLLKILSNRGISFTQITLFNKNLAQNWFKENQMTVFQFVSMGKIL